MKLASCIEAAASPHHPIQVNVVVAGCIALTAAVELRTTQVVKRNLVLVFFGAIASWGVPFLALLEAATSFTSHSYPSSPFTRPSSSTSLPLFFICKVPLITLVARGIRRVVLVFLLLVVVFVVVVEGTKSAIVMVELWRMGRAELARAAIPGGAHSLRSWRAHVGVSRVFP
jgi:hypothetical protein